MLQIKDRHMTTETFFYVESLWRITSSISQTNSFLNFLERLKYLTPFLNVPVNKFGELFLTLQLFAE